MSGVNQKRLVRQFLKLVRVDSPSLEEKKVSRIITQKLRSLGLKPEEDKAGEKISGNAGNIYCFVPGILKNKSVIFLNAHLDTVKPGKNIQPVIKKSVISSAGENILGADDKAGVAIILEVLEVIKENKIPHGNLEIIFTVAEEIGLKGARYLNFKKLKSKFGYVLDGGRHLNHLVTAAPTQKTFQVTILGKAAHAGIHPEKGINAISVAGEAISKIKMGRIDKETTANIGVISGGVATNIVPEKVVIKGEVRSHSEKKMNKKNLEIKKIFEKSSRKAGGRFKWEEIIEYRHYRLAPKSQLVKTFAAALKNKGLKPKFMASGGGSDANIFNEKGIPAAVIPCGMQEPHSSREKLKISSFVKAAELVLEIVTSRDCFGRLRRPRNDRAN